MLDLAHNRRNNFGIKKMKLHNDCFMIDSYSLVNLTDLLEKWKYLLGE